MFETVIVPLDGSPHAELAVPYGIEEATRSGAKIVLLRVLPRPEPYAGTFAHGGPAPLTPVWPAAELAREERQSLAYLDDVRRRFELPETTQAVVAVGEPARRVLAEAGKHPRPLLVMTTGDATGDSHPPVSEVIRRVMKAGTVPVLAVREPPRVQPSGGASSR